MKAAVGYLERHAQTGQAVDPEWSQTQGNAASLYHLLRSFTPEAAVQRWGEEADQNMVGELMRVVEIWDEQELEPVVFS